MLFFGICFAVYHLRGYVLCSFWREADPVEPREQRATLFIDSFLSDEKTGERTQ